MSISELMRRAHKTAVLHGFYENKDPHDIEFIMAQIALMHSELSEAVEALRDRALHIHVEKDKPEGVVVELADCIIRIADLCEALGLDLPSALYFKMEYNKGRPYRHGRVEF